MSGQATINVVDDEEMSSQGSVNAPVGSAAAGGATRTHGDGTDGSGRHPGRMAPDDDAVVGG